MLESIRPDRMDYKQKRCAWGPIVPHGIDGFGKPDDSRKYDDRCDRVMDILNGIQDNSSIPAGTGSMGPGR